MKAESFFIGPFDEDKNVTMDMSLSDVKYLHGVLVETYNSALKKGSASGQLENLVLNLQDVITKRLEAQENNV